MSPQSQSNSDLLSSPGNLIREQSVDSYTRNNQRQKREQGREIGDEPLLINVLVYLLRLGFHADDEKIAIKTGYSVANFRHHCLRVHRGMDFEIEIRIPIAN